MIHRVQKNLVRYYRDTRAAIIVLFAIMAPLLIGSAGMALDYAQAYLVQQRLAQAIDAAALAAAAASSDPDAINQKVQDFFDVNYPEEKLGITFDPVVVINGSLVTVTGVATYETTFLTVLGIDAIDVGAETVVVREVKGLEVVLVLDNTGSMSTNNNIGKLRQAACEFVEILYGTYDPDAVEDDCLERYGAYVEAENEFVKIGLVPYATSVNVGPYGLGYDDEGDAYETAFMNNPTGLEFSNDSDTDLCITEDDDGTDVTDFAGPWDMYRWCRDEDDDEGVCNYYNDYRCNYYNSSHSSCQSYTYDEGERAVYRGPNYICPRASILPLTENMTALKDRIDEMRANGNTYGSTGMVWGWRVLSPDAPFTEGVDWENDAWRKVVVMMTDGNNVYSSPYSAYGVQGTHNVNAAWKIDDRLETTCENMDVQDDVTIYTITFDTGGIDADTEQLYKDCAANGGRHEHVETSDELIEVFRDIAQELSNLHIKG